VVVLDNQEADGLKVIDLGAGHASSGESLCGRILSALRSQALLNESVGSGYIERNWPDAFKEAGAWPLASLRQAFLSGALTLVDPDAVLRTKIPEFVASGEFGLASGRLDASFQRVWFQEPVSAEEVAFEHDVFLVTKAKARELKAGTVGGLEPHPAPGLPPSSPAGPKEEEDREPVGGRGPGPGQTAGSGQILLRLLGDVPPEVWNRIGTHLIPKLRSGSDLKLGLDLSVTADGALAQSLEAELRLALGDLELAERLRLEKHEAGSPPQGSD